MHFRPKTLEELARQALSLEAWGSGLAEFLDEVDAWRRAAATERIVSAIQEEPSLLRSRFVAGDAADAFGAALAEFLAQTCGFRPPAWTRRRERFLAHPWFPLPHMGGHPRLRALLEAQTPEAFRRHNIFIDENSLVRV